MEQDKIIRSLKMQLLIERSVIAAVLLVLFVRWAYVAFADSPFAIMVDDRPVAFLQTREAADKALSAVKRGKAGTENKVTFAQDVRVKRYRGGAPVVSDTIAADNAGKVIRVRMEKWTIFSNGKPVVAVDTREQAGTVLETLKSRFGEKVENILEEPQFKENVKVELVDVDEALYRKSVDEAINAILRPKAESGGKDRVSEYVVKNGDIAAVIAQRQGMSIEKLQSLNPRRNLERLQIGDKLRISGAPSAGKARITVIVRDLSSEVQQIPYTTQTTSSTSMYAGKQFVSQDGRNGLKKVRIAATYENGVRTGHQTLEEEIIREAVARRVVVGIKPR